MDSLFFSNKVMVYLLAETVLLVLATVAFLTTVAILRHWDFGSFSNRQLVLERRAYLVMTIVQLIAVVKSILIVYFVFTIDSLAVLVPGAMCGAGVISANDYGLPLLFVKLLILFCLLFWMRVNHFDLKAKSYPIFRHKSWLFIVIFILMMCEGWLNIVYLGNIDLKLPVSCCSALFGQLEGANPLPFGLDTPKLLVLFYLLYILNTIALITKQRLILVVSSILFVVVAYYSVIYFFGTYIYELPTHKCPFCMMQREYYYIGYAVWGTLFIGIFMTLIWAFMGLLLKDEATYERLWSLMLLSLFVLICTAYVSIYYIRNGVWL